MTSCLVRVSVASALLCVVQAAHARAATAQERLYVASQEDASVAILDAGSGEILETIRLDEMGFGAHAMPHHVVVEPDGSHWYVSLIGAGKVLKLDAGNRLVGQADVETPGMLALDPARGLVYASRSMAAVRPPARIAMIDRERMASEEIDVLFAHPHALALDPLGGRIFTASMAENQLAWVPLGRAEAELLPIAGPMQMMVQLAVSPDGRWLVGGGQMTGDLLVWDISGSAPERTGSVHLGGQPWDPVFTPDGREVWVPNLTESSVSVVDTSGWSVAGVITHPALAEPHGSGVDPAGRTVFVTGRNTKGTYGDGPAGTVVAIDVATRSVRWVATVGRYAAGIAVATPAPRPR